MGVTAVQIEGVDRLLAKLGETESRGVRRVMLKAIVEGAKILRSSIRAEGRSSFKPKSGRMAPGVRYKASRKSTGQLAYMVGPFGKGTHHRHLVIGGHEIVGHAPNLTRTGKRTTPNPFVQRGADAAETAAFEAVARAAQAHFDEIVG